MEQLTIFDLLDDEFGEEIDEFAPLYPDFVNLDLPEIAKIISDATGLLFKPDKFGRYTAKKGKKLYFDLGLGQYYPTVHNGAKYISVGFLDKNDGIYGGGSGVDSIEQAINYFRYIVNRRTRKDHGENI